MEEEEEEEEEPESESESESDSSDRSLSAAVQNSSRILGDLLHLAARSSSTHAVRSASLAGNEKHKTRRRTWSNGRLD